MRECINIQVLDIKNQLLDIKTRKTVLSIDMKEKFALSKRASEFIKRTHKEINDSQAFIKTNKPFINSLHKMKKEHDSMSKIIDKKHLIDCAKNAVLSEKADKKQAVLKAKRFNLKAFDRLPFHMLRYISEFLPYEIRTEILEKKYSPYVIRPHNRTIMNSVNNDKLLKHLHSLSEVVSIYTANPEIYRTKPNVANNKMKFRCLMNTLKTENPEFAYNLIRKISILFLQSNRPIPPCVHLNDLTDQ
jgi:hypothetical protein